MANQPDVISIGDIVTDAFIKLFDNQAQAYENEYGKWLAMQFGTKLPFDHVEVVQAVGNAANAAVAFARLGLNSSFVTKVFIVSGRETHICRILRGRSKQFTSRQYVLYSLLNSTYIITFCFSCRDNLTQCTHRRQIKFWLH